MYYINQQGSNDEITSYNTNNDFVILKRYTIKSNQFIIAILNLNNMVMYISSNMLLDNINEAINFLNILNVLYPNHLINESKLIDVIVNDNNINMLDVYCVDLF